MTGQVNIQVSAVWAAALGSARKSIALLAMLFFVCCRPASAQQQAPVPAVSVTNQGGNTQSQEQTTQDPGSGPCPPLWVYEGDHVMALAFSPDGQWLATTGSGHLHTTGEIHNYVTIWNAVTGKLVRRWETGQLSYQIVFNPNGDQLAYSQNGKIEVRDFQKDTVLYTLAGGPLAYSPDGKILAIGWYRALRKSEIDQSGQSRNYTVEIHDAATGKLLRAFDVSQFNIYALAITRDGILFDGSCTDDDICQGTAGAWSLASGKLLKNYDFEASAFSPDGRWAAIENQSGDSGEVKVMDLATNTEMWSFDAAAATFSPDWKEVALRKQNVIHLNSLGTGGKEIQTVPNGGGPLAFSPDGKKLAAANYHLTAKHNDR